MYSLSVINYLSGYLQIQYLFFFLFSFNRNSIHDKQESKPGIFLYRTFVNRCTSVHFCFYSMTVWIIHFLSYIKYRTSFRYLKLETIYKYIYWLFEDFFFLYSLKNNKFFRSVLNLYRRYTKYSFYININ